MYNGTLNPCGAVHITIGDGGNTEGLAHKLLLPETFCRNVFPDSCVL